MCKAVRLFRRTGINAPGDGSILVVVLCLLAVMMILGAALSVVVRTERVCSGNYADGVRVRHLLLAGLARAVHDIDRSMAGSLPGSQYTNGLVYPPWNVLSSTNPCAIPGSTAQKPLTGRLVYGEALRYVPASLRDLARKEEAVWEDAGGAAPNLRVSYTAVNVSGFLDACVAGGKPRLRGAGPEEATLECLPEMLSATNFLALRNDDLRYETLPELADLQALPNGAGGFPAGTEPSSFVVYSHYPVRGLPPAGEAATGWSSIDGDAQELAAKWFSVADGFMRGGITSQFGPMFAAFNLCDYVDPDRLPGNMGGTYYPEIGPWLPFVDAFPMINEVYLEWVICIESNESPPGIRYRAAYPEIAFECIYPFLLPLNPGDFTFRATVTFTNELWGQWHFEPTAGNPVDTGVQTIGTNTYWTHTLGSVGFDWRSAPALPTNRLVVAAAVAVDIRDAAGNLVDGIPKLVPLELVMSNNVPVNTNKSWTVWFPGGGPTFKEPDRISRECLDPRLNCEISERFWPQTNVSSIGFVNGAARDFWATNALSDGDQWMYVKQAPVESVAELGAIFFGEPWQTVRLYNHGSSSKKEPGAMHTVLDFFTVADDPLKARKGLVNVNTRSPDVLAAVLANMPIREWMTNSAGISTCRFAGSDVIMDVLTNASSTDYFGVLPAGQLTNLSDIGYLDWSPVWDSNRAQVVNYGGHGNEFCEIDREAVIRNSAGMFGVRQNLFVIIVGAGHFREGVGVADGPGGWVTRQRAVAEVWRDPYPAPGSTAQQEGHRWFVRMFKQLGEG